MQSDIVKLLPVTRAGANQIVLLLVKVQFVTDTLAFPESRYVPNQGEVLSYGTTYSTDPPILNTSEPSLSSISPISI